MRGVKNSFCCASRLKVVLASVCGDVSHGGKNAQTGVFIFGGCCLFCFLFFFFYCCCCGVCNVKVNWKAVKAEVGFWNTACIIYIHRVHGRGGRGRERERVRETNYTHILSCAHTHTQTHTYTHQYRTFRRMLQFSAVIMPSSLSPPVPVAMHKRFWAVGSAKINTGRFSWLVTVLHKLSAVFLFVCFVFCTRQVIGCCFLEDVFRETHWLSLLHFLLLVAVFLKT